MSNPIVYLVPGMAGSFLRRRRRFLPDDYVWIPEPFFGAVGPSGLALASNGIDSALGSGVQIYPAGVLNTYYGRLYQRLLDDGNDVRLWSYDWRQSVAVAAERLFNEIITLPGFPAVSVIAHSMGGLVARLLWKRAASVNSTDRISRVVTLGTPWGGSFEAVRVCAHANQSWFPIFRLLSLATRGYEFSNGYKLIDYLTSTWPGFHELIPLVGSHTVNGDVPAAVATASFYQPLNQSISQPYLDAGQTVLRGIGNVPIDPTKWCIVRGTNILTAQMIRPGGRLNVEQDYYVNYEGDGVVPSWSATDPVAHGYVFKNIDHGGICSDPAVLSLLNVFLNSNPPTSDALVS